MSLLAFRPVNAHEKGTNRAPRTYAPEKAGCSRHDPSAEPYKPRRKDENPKQA